MEWVPELIRALTVASFGASRVGDNATYQAIVKLIAALDKKYYKRKPQRNP